MLNPGEVIYAVFKEIKLYGGDNLPISGICGDKQKTLYRYLV